MKLIMDEPSEETLADYTGESHTVIERSISPHVIVTALRNRETDTGTEFTSINEHSALDCKGLSPLPLFKERRCSARFRHRETVPRSFPLS